MIQITTMHKWMGATLAWPLFWVLVFDRWFFLSPLGLLIAFGLPIAGWVAWWKLYQGKEQKIVDGGRLVVGRSLDFLFRLKKKFPN